nr:MAG TPA: hypothetical protein [Caudoviricetes sp.]
MLGFVTEPRRWGIVRLPPTDGTTLGEHIKSLLSVSSSP